MVSEANACGSKSMSHVTLTTPTNCGGLYVFLSFMHPRCATCNSWLCWPCRGVFGALVAGMVAGLWGVTGWIGFSYYLASHAVVSPSCLRCCICAFTPHHRSRLGPVFWPSALVMY